MARKGFLIIGALAASTSAVIGMASAHAATQVPFTITEHANFATGVMTFTATGPLCPSGTFVNDATVFAFLPKPPEGGLNLLAQTAYTCDDGTGSFNAVKEFHITFHDDSSSATGPVQLRAGTGAYTDLAGHGMLNNATSGDTGVGQISGFIVPAGL